MADCFRSLIRMETVAMSEDPSVTQSPENFSDTWRKVVLENALDAVIGVDHHGLIVDWNKQAEVIFGIPRDEALGKNMAETIVPPGFRAGHNAGMARFLKTGKGTIVNQRIEVEGFHRNGRVFPLELTVIPLWVDGSYLFYSFIRDISSRKKNESVLKESQNKYRDLVEGINHGIVWSADRESLKFTFVSTPATHLTGFPPEQWGAENDFFINHVYVKDKQRVLDAFAKVQSSETEVTLEHRFVASDGRLLWFSTGIRLASRDSGDELEFRGLSVDVTGNKESERRIAAQYEAVKVLAQSTTSKQASTSVLQAVGENLGWELGCVWIPDGKNQHLTCIADWNSNEENYEDFIASTRSCSFELGKGMPGLVWQTRAPQWRSDVSEDSQLRRADLFKQLKLHAGLWFPIQIGNRFYGVLEFLSRELRAPDAGLLRTMSILGDQMAQVLERINIEEVLRIRSQVLENMSEGVSLSDENGIILYTNPAEDHMFGYLQGELVGQPVSVQNAAPERENLEKVTVVINELNQNGRWAGEWQNKRKDGSTFYTRSQISRLEISGRSHFVCVQEDITLQKKAQKALEESEIQFKNFADSIPQLAWMANADGWIFWYNKRWYEFTGTTSGDMEGWGWQSVQHPDHLPAVLKKWGDAIAAGVTFEMTFPIRGDDGKFRWFLTLASPIKNSEGTVVRWFGTNTDITHQQETEQALRESQERLKLAFDIAEIGAWEINLTTGSVTLDERCKICFGLPLDTPNLPLSDILDLLHRDEKEKVNRLLSAATDPTGDGKYVAECRTAPSKGKSRWLYAKGTAVFNYNRTAATSVIGTILDISERKEAEEVLARSEARFRTAFVDAPIPVMIHAEGGEVFQVNRAWCTLSGYEASELTTLQSWVKLAYPPADFDVIMSRIVRCYSYTEADSEGEFLINTKKDGQSSWTFSSAPLGRLPDGRALVISMAMDVTERRKIEDSLKKSEESFRTMTEAIPQIVWTSGPNGGDTYLNQRWHEYTGISEEHYRIVGMQSAVHPEDTANLLHKWAEVSTSGSEFSAEYRIKSKEGTYRWFLGRALPLRDEKERIIKWFGTATDIDESKRAQLAQRLLDKASVLLSSSLDYETTLQSVSELAVNKICDWCGIDILNAEGMLEPVAVAHKDPAMVTFALEFRNRYPVDMNAAGGAPGVVRTGEAELYPEISDDLLVLSAIDETHLAMMRSLKITSLIIVPLVRGGKPCGTLTLVLSGNERRFTSEDLSLAKELARRASSAIENAKLFTELREQEASLNEAVRARDEFLSIASHELKTPLTPIKLQLGLMDRMLKAGTLSSERVKKVLDTSNRQITRLAALVDDLLDVARINSGKLALSIESHNLVDVLMDICERYSEQTCAAGIQVNISTPSSVVAEFDPPRIEQVIINLLANAIKYAPGKPVLVTVAQTSEMVSVAVQDSGPGIAKENLGRIFERFERVKSKDTVGGLGLGLYISRQIIESHGGHINAVSELGRGTTFYFEIPLVSRVTQ